MRNNKDNTNGDTPFKLDVSGLKESLLFTNLPAVESAAKRYRDKGIHVRLFVWGLLEPKTSKRSKEKSEWIAMQIATKTTRTKEPRR